MPVLNPLTPKVPQGTNAAGVSLAGTAAAADQTFKNSGNELLFIETGSTATVCTVTRSQPSNYGFTQNLTVTVAANSRFVLGPLDPNWFNNDSGEVELAWSATTNVKVAVVRMVK